MSVGYTTPNTIWKRTKYHVIPIQLCVLQGDKPSSNCQTCYCCWSVLCYARRRRRACGCRIGQVRGDNITDENALIRTLESVNLHMPRPIHFLLLVTCWTSVKYLSLFGYIWRNSESLLDHSSLNFGSCNIDRVCYLEGINAEKQRITHTSWRSCVIYFEHDPDDCEAV